MEKPRSRAPRKRRSVEEKRAVVAAFRESGLSAREFCAKHGIVKSGLWSWIRELSPSPPSRPPRTVTFAPVRVSEPRTSASSVWSASRVVLEIARRDGLCVRVFDGASSQQVDPAVAALARSVPC